MSECKVLDFNIISEVNSVSLSPLGPREVLESMILREYDTHTEKHTPHGVALAACDHLHFTFIGCNRRSAFIKYNIIDF